MDSFFRLWKVYDPSEVVVKQERFCEKRSCFFAFCGKIVAFAQAREMGIEASRPHLP